MGRFVVRRLAGMFLVMFVVSALTFLIFNVIPNGDPAARMAGKVPTESQIERIREDWGFDDPIWQQYLTTMKKVFTGDLVSYTNQSDVMDEIIRGRAAHVLAGDRRGGDVAGARCCARPLQRHAGGPVQRPLPHRARAGRASRCRCSGSARS